MPAAHAERRDARAETNPGGVEVVITVGEDGSAHVAPGSAAGNGNGNGGGGGGGSAAGGCRWTVIEYPFSGVDPPANFGDPPSPEHRLYLVFCDGDFVGTRWLGPAADGTGGPGVDTAALARTVVEQVPVDLATIGARPEGRAVTGIPSYFWVDGYDGSPITGTVANGPVSVAVAITLGTVTWDFGDGSPPLRAGLGEAWPARSRVRHAYRDRGTYDVTVTLVLPARFTVGGGRVTALEPVVRTATTRYVVDEVQAVRRR